MPIFHEENIGKIIFSCSVVLVGILSAIFSALFVIDQYRELEIERPKIEEEFLNQQKELLHTAVVMQVNQIDFRRQQINQRLKEILKSRVHEAKSIANNLARQNSPEKSWTEIEKIVRQSLGPIRFNDGEDYFFGFTMDGKVTLYPPDFTTVGKRSEEVFSPQKLGVINDLRDIVRVKGEGFLEYEWPVPGAQAGKTYKKISYVAGLSGFDWFIGSGSYYSDFAGKIKKEILTDIAKSMGDDPKNYFFVYGLNNIFGGENFGTLLVNPNRPDLVGTQLSDEYRGAHGKAFRKEFLDGLQKGGEAYVRYWYKKPGDENPKQKLSYFKLYPEWNWVVAKGVYLDDLEDIIHEKEVALETRVKAKLATFSLLSLVVIAVVVMLAHFFTRFIYGILEEYKKVQRQQRDELERINQTLHQQSITDSLTNICNRSSFNDHLDEELGRASRYAIPLSLVIIDIDHFKEINDSLGHLKGDTVLVELTELIQANIRQTDIFARWGGEEFVLLVPESGSEATRNLAEKLCKLVAGHSFSIEHQVTCSFGITAYIPGDQASTFLDRADQALYVAKQSGRNRVAHR